MNPFIDSLTRLSNIKRFSTHRITHWQNVATHSYNVCMLAMYIADSDGIKLNMEKLLRKALLHDLGESTLGDIPSPTKKFNPRIHNEIHNIEKQMLKAIFKGSKTKWYRTLAINCKTGKEGRLIALADVIERLIYLTAERHSGNKIVNDMYSDTLEMLNSKKYQRILDTYPTARKLMEFHLKQITSD